MMERGHDVHLSDKVHLGFVRLKLRDLYSDDFCLAVDAPFA